MITAPGPLPKPASFYEQAWAAQLVRSLERFFQTLAGDLVSVSQLITRKGRLKHVTLVTDAAYTILNTDEVIDVDRAGAVTLTLPVPKATGHAFRVQDSSGDASSNNITIARPNATYDVNDAASVAISTDYGVVDIVYNGVQYIAG